MRRAWTLFGALCLGTVAASAEEASGLSLADALQSALSQAPVVLEAKAEREAARHQKRVGLAAILPIVRAQGSVLHRRERYSYERRLPFLATSLSTRITDLELLLVQPLVRLDRWAMKELGEEGDRLAVLIEQAARAQWLLEVARRWADLAATKEALQAAEARLRAAEEAAKSAKIKHRLGLIATPQQLAAQAALARARASVLAARQRWRVQRAELASMIGRKRFRLPDPLRWPRLLATLSAEEARRQSAQALALRIAEERWRMARLRAKQALGSALPALDLVAGWQRQRTTNTIFGTGQTATNTWVGLQLDVPIYAGGGAWAEYRRQQALVEKARWALEEERRKARLMAERTVASLAMLDARIEALAEARKAAEEAARSARAAFEVGSGRIEDWLDAEARRMQAASELAAARADRLKVEAAWLAWLGAIDRLVQ